MTYSELIAANNRGHQARRTHRKYRSKSTDWLKPAFTLFLHAAFSKLRFIFGEPAGLMVKPQ
jgi:hypothetical protein